MSVGESLAVGIIFGLFILLGISLIVAYINCRIYYEPNQFTHRNFFGIKRTYKYSDITGVRRGVSDTTIYVGKKKILVDSISNGEDFLRLVDLWGGKSIKKVKSKLFNDNIHNPEEFIFAFSILPIYIIGLMIFLNILDKPLKLEDLNYITTQITDYSEIVDEDGDTNLLLSISGYSTNVTIYSYDELIENFSQFESAVSNGEEFNIYFDKSVEDFVENGGTGVDMLSDIDGNVYISLDSTNARDKENITIVNIMMSIVLVFAIIFMLVAFYVMSHADKFPRAIKLFVKDSYIKR
jgi:hypothetical protein